ncbi:MazG nucleotide pyrophosphohydrolase domain-containing protein [Bacillus toyonensis]|uniref:MazG nucleotide pyrophosphohydrolase domain-containing protein n=1 Tax=Bacillus toyonensis TaxID=155322 RepID=UPI000BF88AD5|nr:MazG nucleotide pyrophosphohydrolase domain-containing protein [Bacillus toyonensis]PGF05137.1 pyrophosphatase [Bacillus toyonensis]
MPNDGELTIKDFQKHVEDFCKEKGFENTSIEMRTMYLMSEVGELVDSILKGDKTEIGLEMFDVVWNVFDLANKLDINVNEAFQNKMDINKDRVWVNQE